MDNNELLGALLITRVYGFVGMRVGCLCHTLTTISPKQLEQLLVATKSGWGAVSGVIWLTGPPWSLFCSHIFLFIIFIAKSPTITWNEFLRLLHFFLPSWRHLILFDCFRDGRGAQFRFDLPTLSESAFSLFGFLKCADRQMKRAQFKAKIKRSVYLKHGHPLNINFLSIVRCGKRPR